MERHDISIGTFRYSGRSSSIRNRNKFAKNIPQNSAKTMKKSDTPQTLPDITTRIFGRTATLARFLLLNKTKEPQG